MGRHSIALDLDRQITVPEVLEQIEALKSHYPSDYVFEIYPAGGELDIYVYRKQTPEGLQKDSDDYRSKRYAEYLELKELVDKGEI